MRTLFLLVLLCSIGCRRGSAKDQAIEPKAVKDRTLIALPVDPKAIVITLNYVASWDHFSVLASRRKSTDPYLTILADGSTTAQEVWDTANKVETKLSAAELQELLQVAIHDNHFFQFSETKAIAAIKAGKYKSWLMLSDQDTTIICIKTEEKEHLAATTT